MMNEIVSLEQILRKLKLYGALKALSLQQADAAYTAMPFEQRLAVPVNCGKAAILPAVPAAALGLLTLAGAIRY